MTSCLPEQLKWNTRQKTAKERNIESKVSVSNSRLRLHTHLSTPYVHSVKAYKRKEVVEVESGDIKGLYQKLAKAVYEAFKGLPEHFEVRKPVRPAAEKTEPPPPPRRANEPEPEEGEEDEEQEDEEGGNKEAGEKGGEGTVDGGEKK